MTVIFRHHFLLSMLTQLFQSFNLDAKESKCIAALVEMGPQPASALSRLLGMPRNTVRGILDALTQHGLLTKTRRGNTQYYAVENADGLTRILRGQQRAFNEETEERIRVIETYGHELTQYRQASGRPKVTFYEGMSGLERVYEDTLIAKTGLRSWGSYDANKEALPSYFQTYYQRRTKKGIPMKSIHPDTALSRAHQKNDRRELRTSALVPKTVFDLKPEIQVYDDKINIVSWRDKFGIIIESQEIADAVRLIFELSYDAAKKYGRVTGAKKKTRKKS